MDGKWSKIRSKRAKIHIVFLLRITFKIHASTYVCAKPARGWRHEFKFPLIGAAVKANRLIAARFPARSPRGSMFPRIIRQLFFDRPLRRDSTISGQILIHVLRFTGGLRAVCIEISSYTEEKESEREREINEHQTISYFVLQIGRNNDNTSLQISTIIFLIKGKRASQILYVIKKSDEWK